MWLPTKETVLVPDDWRVLRGIRISAAGDEGQWMFIPANRTIPQSKTKILQKKIPLYKATTLRIFVTPFFNGLVVSFPNYCSTVQKKWKRINCAEIRRNKLRTFFSNEKTAKFRCIYCSNVGEISQSRWWTDTRFYGIRRNFISKFRARKDENSCHWNEISSAETKFRFQKFLSAYRIQL